MLHTHLRRLMGMKLLERSLGSSKRGQASGQHAERPWAPILGRSSTSKWSEFDAGLPQDPSLLHEEDAIGTATLALEMTRSVFTYPSIAA